MTTRYSITTEEQGYPNYEAFNDVTLAGDLESAAIARIVVEYGSYINSLTVCRLLRFCNLDADLLVYQGGFRREQATVSQTRNGWNQRR